MRFDLSMDVKRRLMWYLVTGVFLLAAIFTGFKYVDKVFDKSVKTNGLLARMFGYQKPPPFEINEFAVEESANKGDHESQYLLALQKLDGSYYRFAKQTTPDFATRAREAIPILAREATLGNTSACFHLGLLYDSEYSSNNKCHPNTTLAIHYYKKAGILDHSLANFKLFKIYFNKSRGYYNPNQALDYLEKYVKYYDLVNDDHYCYSFKLNSYYIVKSYIELLIATRRYKSPYVRRAVNILLMDIEDDSIDLRSDSLQLIKALADAGFDYAKEEYKTTSENINFNIKAQRVKNRVKDKGEQYFRLAEILIDKYNAYDRSGTDSNGNSSQLSSYQISEISGFYIESMNNKYIYAALRYNLFLYYYGDINDKKDALDYLENIHFLQSPGKTFNISSFHDYKLYKEVLIKKTYDYMTNVEKLKYVSSIYKQSYKAYKELNYNLSKSSFLKAHFLIPILSELNNNVSGFLDRYENRWIGFVYESNIF